MTLQDNFYSDKKNVEKIFSEINRRKFWLENIDIADELLEEAELFLEMALEDTESNEPEEFIKSFNKFKNKIEDLETRSMLSGEADDKNAIFSIHAGSGGTEAQDWAAMLYRMYKRYFDEMGFKVAEIDFLPGDIVGVKSVTVEITGEYAYGYTKSEMGVHRLIRLSPFDAQHKRHTSFASVSVMPEAEDIEVELDMGVVRVDTYRASGAGGQHVNKTDSAVRLTHEPTGIVVQSQAQRSQTLNKEFAIKVLKAKLYQQKLEEENKKRQELEGEKKEISWGSQIRTYTFHPYNLVKDHRTNSEVGNTQNFMDGNILPFVKEYLLKFGNKI